MINKTMYTKQFCKQEELVECVFTNIIQNHRSHDWLAECSILAPKNIQVNAMNFKIQKKLPGEVITYKSIDSVMDEKEAVNYPIEFLNSLDPPGTPPHLLNLKVDSPIILLRNINPPKMCNGTRLVIKKLMPNLIEATILNGKAKGENVLIPRILMIPTDMPFDFKRLQFPVRLSFAKTINKAQGQTFQICGVNLEESWFSHGQLYVACSRVGTAHRLFIHAPDSKTKNVVYQNVLD
ncbi:ATP-dependent DNA helicase PIF6-like [Bactrocera neohumeralis]|uniref:ATP-dependent DNA helicase PIF6-like n=1 Tax=Bactrocera tryoni TaxID=59916 RepID=UPI001A965B8F|nr:ATP-dependent DNA helicase PIF6-like [Bactrocera tryoni]XP_050338207.1 ATP-dependent DNA helicase PIF6-like [Bactrocera neohumeralis]